MTNALNATLSAQGHGRESQHNRKETFASIRKDRYALPARSRRVALSHCKRLRFRFRELSEQLESDIGFVYRAPVSIDMDYGMLYPPPAVLCDYLSPILTPPLLLGVRGLLE